VIDFKSPEITLGGGATMSTLAIDKLDELDKKIKNLQIARETLRKFMARNCKHPYHEVTEFAWEHDDGYGRQTMLSGLKCGICYKSQHFYGPNVTKDNLDDFYK
jgi:hypothetical protein